jgi:hypothetical protein
VAIRAYQPFVFPGVLQTPATAEYLLSWLTEGLTEEDRKVRFDVRMLRAKRIVDNDRAPTYMLMLDEAVLGREVGGRAIMAEQLEAAVEFAQRPNIHIRIVKMAEGVHLGMLGPFTILDLSDDDTEDAILYREFYISDELTHDPEALAYHRARFEADWVRSYSEADSLRLLRAAAATLGASLVRDPLTEG